MGPLIGMASEDGNTPLGWLGKGENQEARGTPETGQTSPSSPILTSNTQA